MSPEDGGSLVLHAQRWSKGRGRLWLTTYDNVPWNRPWYERLGFARVGDAHCGPELRSILAEERAALPSADARVAMVYRASG